MKHSLAKQSLYGGSLLSLGPQNCNRILIEGERDPVIEPVKSTLSSSEGWGGTHLFTGIIEDVCRCFEERYGTGASALMGYATLLLDCLTGLERTPEALHTALQLLQETFAECCECLALVHNLPKLIPESTPVVTAVNDVEDVDDVSWFFDVPVLTELLPSPDLETDDSRSESVCFTRWNILRGLQHTLPWEYDQSPPHYAEHDISLPMALADLAWNSLNISSFPIPLQNSVRPAEPEEMAAAIQDIHDRVAVHMIQGSRTSSSSVYSDALVLFCDKPRAGSATIGVRVYESCVRAQRARGVEGITRVALVDQPVCVDDRSAAGLRMDGSGASQQADDIQNRTTYTVPFSDNENRSASYIEKCVSCLQKLEVHLLLCPHPLSLKLVDACFEHNICVLPASPAEIHSMGRMVGADVVEDVLDLDNDALGRGYRVSLTLRDDVRRVDEDVEQGRLTLKESVMVVLHPKPKEKLFEIRNDGYANSCRGGRKCSCVAVIISCPSTAIGLAIKDRVMRCLHRLCLATNRGALMPGAGTAEMLCSAVLEERQGHLNIGKNYAEVALCLNNIQQALENFAYIVSVNAGLSPQDSMSNWYSSRKSIVALKCGTKGDLLTQVRRLTPSEKCKLLAPIRLHPECTYEECGVLDVVVVRIKAMQAAVYAVKSALDAETMVFNRRTSSQFL